MSYGGFVDRTGLEIEPHRQASSALQNFLSIGPSRFIGSTIGMADLAGNNAFGYFRNVGVVVIDEGGRRQVGESTIDVTSSQCESRL